MKSTLSLVTASFNSVQNILSPSLVVVFGCETHSECKLSVFEYRVLKKMCVSKREEVT